MFKIHVKYSISLLGSTKDKVFEHILSFHHININFATRFEVNKNWSVKSIQYYLLLFFFFFSFLCKVIKFWFFVWLFGRDFFVRQMPRPWTCLSEKFTNVDQDMVGAVIGKGDITGVFSGTFLGYIKRKFFFCL